MASAPLTSTQSVLEYTKNAAAVIESLAPAGGTVLTTIAKLSQEITTTIEGLQIMKANREQFIRITEDIHHILVALTSVFVTSESMLDLKMLDEIGMFVGYEAIFNRRCQTAKEVRTLQKLYGSLRRQQELGKFRRILKQGQMSVQLEAHELELSRTLEFFTMRLSTSNALKIVEISGEIGARHQQLLDLIATESDKASTISSGRSLARGSSSSMLSILPAQPQIFFGREKELEHTTKILVAENARLAILGAGGIGKTTLATMSLHNSAVVEKYRERYFIPCESANRGPELITLVGFQLGLEPSRELSRAIVDYFQRRGPVLIVFDNLDTVWEPADFRSEVEEFLSLLADIPNLTIVITMRGSERPGKVKWTRPFLPVLEPLAVDASRDIFLEIADFPSPGEEAAFSELLELTDNLPLAINVLAYQVASEGYSAVLSRWKVENVDVISKGFDKGSSLDQSIILSLSCPRIVNAPQAVQLLALISLLPDGIQDEDLIAAHVPITALAECKTALLRTSLAYTNADKRLKALNPIREFVRSRHPAPVALAQPLRTYFQEQLFLWRKYHNNILQATLTPHLIMNTSNIQSLLLHCLQHEEQHELENVGHTILEFDRFSNQMLKGHTPLMEYVPKLFDTTGDRRLYWEYFSWLLIFQKEMPPGKDVDNLLDEAIQYFEGRNDHAKQVRLYLYAGDYHMLRGNVPKAAVLSDLAISLARDSETPELLEGLHLAALIERGRGNYLKSLQYGRAMSELSLRLGLIGSEVHGLRIMSSAYLRLGKLHKALEHCRIIQQLIEFVGQQRGSQHTVARLDMEATIHYQKTEYLDAYSCCERILSLTTPYILPFFHADALKIMAETGVTIGRKEDEIRSQLATARNICIQLSWKAGLFECNQTSIKVDLMAGDKTKVAPALEGLLSTARDHPDQMFRCLEVLGNPASKLLGLVETFQWAVTYFALAMKVKFLGHIYQSLRCIGDLLLTQGDEETALQIFHTVLAGSTEMDVHRRRADCMTRIGDISARRGEISEAREMWQQARPLFIVSSQVEDVAAIDVRLAEEAPVCMGNEAGDVAKAEPSDGKGEEV